MSTANGTISLLKATWHRKKMQQLLTIGYEKATLTDFLATLKQGGVTLLLDVRELALSRRKGFSKRALSDALASVGIGYRHERELGSPRAIRQQLHIDGNHRQFFDAFGGYLKSKQSLLAELASSLTGNVALMCFEQDFKTCHRQVVALQLELLTGLKTQHLGVLHGLGDPREGPDSGQSVSAAQP